MRKRSASPSFEKIGMYKNNKKKSRARAFCSRFCVLSRRGALVISLLMVSSVAMVGSCDVSRNALGITPAQAAVTASAGALSKTEQHRYSTILENIVLRDMDRLQGLHRGDLEILLHEPSLARKDGAVEIRQYRSASCVLDVYIAGQAAQDTVVHYELRQRDKAYLVTPAKVAEPTDRAACFRSIMASTGGSERHNVLARLF